MPDEPQRTIIRRNLFVNADGGSEGPAVRPNVSVGHFPLQGPGQDDEYLIYGNRFFQNAHEVLLQDEGNIALYNNLLPGKVHEARRVVRLIERTAHRHGQPLLLPALEVEGWWTNLDAAAFAPDGLIALYQRRGTSEQYHSEFKADLDLERLPSGKFDTNLLVLALAALAYNILRYLGQDTLIGPDAPIRKAVHRRRRRTSSAMAGITCRASAAAIPAMRRSRAATRNSSSA